MINLEMLQEVEDIDDVVIQAQISRGESPNPDGDLEGELSSSTHDWVCSASEAMRSQPTLNDHTSWPVHVRDAQ